MIPLPRPSITRKQRNVALIVAMIADAIDIAGWPFFIWGCLGLPFTALDAASVIALIAICGFRWQFAVALGFELVPVLALFPTWTAFVLTLPVADGVIAQDAQVVRATQVHPRQQPQPRRHESVIIDAEEVKNPAPPKVPPRLAAGDEPKDRPGWSGGL